jgi:hypothetical protein
MRLSMRLVTAAVAAAVVVAAVLAGFLVMRLRGPGGAPVDVATWAQRMCAAEGAYAAAIAKTNDNVDPTTLDLQVRKQRADRIGKAEIDAALHVAKALQAFTPPESVRAFHQALIHDAEEEAAATREQLDAIARATTPQQIVLANVQVRFRRDASAQNLGAAAEGLTPDVLQVIGSQPGCVGAPVPGAPPAVPGTNPGGPA